MATEVSIVSVADSEPARVVQIWYDKIVADHATYQNYWPALDKAEQAHAEKMNNALLRKRYVEAHGRLRTILAQTLNVAPEKIRINKTEHGKPYLVDTPELVFNLSHSVDEMILAVSYNCRLGVDIEYCKPRANLAGLAEKCFAEEEIAYWQHLPEQQKIIEFYRFWTRKEAFVKATGRGIGLGLNQCVSNPENPAKFLRVPAESGQAADWHARDIAFETNSCAAIVIDKLISEIKYLKL